MTQEYSTRAGRTTNEVMCINFVRAGVQKITDTLKMASPRSHIAAGVDRNIDVGDKVKERCTLRRDLMPVSAHTGRDGRLDLHFGWELKSVRDWARSRFVDRSHLSGELAGGDQGGSREANSARAEEVDTEPVKLDGDGPSPGFRIGPRVGLGDATRCHMWRV